MSILLQKNVGDYSYMSSPNIYYRAINFIAAFFDSCRHSVKIKDIWYTIEEYTSRDKKGILYERRCTNFIHQDEFVR